MWEGWLKAFREGKSASLSIWRHFLRLITISFETWIYSIYIYKLRKSGLIKHLINQQARVAPKSIQIENKSASLSIWLFLGIIIYALFHGEIWIFSHTFIVKQKTCQIQIFLKLVPSDILYSTQDKYIQMKDLIKYTIKAHAWVALKNKSIQISKVSQRHCRSDSSWVSSYAYH